MQKTINKITMAGKGGARIKPDGANYKIEILQGGVWITAVSGLTKPIAESILENASNRTICG